MDIMKSTEPLMARCRSSLLS